MSASNKILQAAAGNAAGESVYVEDVFSTVVYSGGSAHNFEVGVDMTEGGLLWFKQRSNFQHHALFDSESNSDFNKYLRSDGANALDNLNDAAHITVDSEGFNLTSTGYNLSNNSGRTYVTWMFRKQAGFFDVVTWTGDGNAGRDISHNLGSTPGCIAIKRLSGSENWQVYHRSLSNPDTKILAFNLTQGEMNQSTPANVHSATATKFSVGSDTSVNYSGQTYVAYVFAHDDQSFGDNSDESIIKCGSYTGNASTAGPVVELGFEPQWVMIKGLDRACDWVIFDVMRGMPVTGTTPFLEANDSAAETTNFGNVIFPHATGFTIAQGATSNVSEFNEGYIYIAIRRPMKTPEAGTDVFYYATQDASSPGHEAPVGNWPVDWAIKTKTSGVDNRTVATRLLGAGYLVANSTDTFSSNSDYSLDYQNGFFESTSAYSDRFAWMFKRGAKCFDVVAYTGDGTAGRTVSHGLGVSPEMIIVKKRDGTTFWSVGVFVSGVINYSTPIKLNDNSTPFNDDPFNRRTTAQGATAFEVGSAGATNGSGGNYVAYLWATLDGVSKVGSYTGTGSDINVDCGFSAGARFILIRRTDSGDNWYVYDSTRGIVAGNDPYMLLNSTAAETTGTDYIDPLNAGFTVTSSAPAALNASGGTYIFLAIA